MATRLLFSFDIGGAPVVAGALPPAVLAAMGARPKRQLLSHVWVLECASDADAKAFSHLLAAIQAQDPDFVFIVLSWIDGSPDISVTSREAA